MFSRPNIFPIHVLVPIRISVILCYYVMMFLQFLVWLQPSVRIELHWILEIFGAVHEVDPAVVKDSVLLEEDSTDFRIFQEPSRETIGNSTDHSGNFIDDTVSIGQLLQVLGSYICIWLDDRIYLVLEFFGNLRFFKDINHHGREYCRRTIDTSKSKADNFINQIINCLFI